MADLEPVCVINVVGMTPRLLEHARHMRELAGAGRFGPLRPALPAVTCTAQATMLTGTMPAEHGIVGNGWYWRQTGEVRFWLQSNRLMEAEPLYVTARRAAQRQGKRFTCAKLFWWFNQGAAVDWSVTPKPYHGADGSKVPAIHGTPAELVRELEHRCGKFPFQAFWGPLAGGDSSSWISRSAMLILGGFAACGSPPTLTLAYLPHLDYDLQRFGPNCEEALRQVAEVDRYVGLIAELARDKGIRLVLVSEYGLVPVHRPVAINRVLRQEGMLAVRDGPFGETIDTFNCRALAVADHQVAHVYVQSSADIPPVKRLIESLDGVAEVLDREGLKAVGLDHPRSGELLALAERDAWFCYYYWLDDDRMPDFARTVDIHRKPGYDPCELFFDPSLPCPKLRTAWRMLQRKLGFRALFDVVATDPSLVRGSHGLLPAGPADGPIISAGDGMPEPLPQHMSELKPWLLRALGLAEDRQAK